MPPLPERQTIPEQQIAHIEPKITNILGSGHCSLPKPNHGGRGLPLHTHLPQCLHRLEPRSFGARPLPLPSQNLKIRHLRDFHKCDQKVLR